MLMQQGEMPHLVRLYDPFDSLLHSSDGPSSGGVMALLRPIRDLLSARAEKGDKGKSAGLSAGRRRAIAMALGKASWLNRLGDAFSASCLMIVGFQGHRGEAAEQLERAGQLLESAGGVDGGEGPGLRWRENRYSVSFKQSAIFESGAFVDTMEVSCTWGCVAQVYEAVRKAVASQALIMAHFSHAYAEGCSIYFTFASYRGKADALERCYNRVWRDALSAVSKAGGSISHHHGIGVAKRDAMRREHGAGLRLLFALKDGLDPTGVLNPGKLLPDRTVTS